MVAGISAGQWSSLVRACGVETGIAALESSTHRQFSKEADRYESRDAIAALLEPWFAARSLDEVRRSARRAQGLLGSVPARHRFARERPRASRGNPVFGEVETRVWASISLRAVPFASRIRPPARLGRHQCSVEHTDQC
jgi:2-methylfumaryl-CoA isomerase